MVAAAQDSYMRCTMRPTHRGRVGSAESKHGSPVVNRKGRKPYPTMNALLTLSLNGDYLSWNAFCAMGLDPEYPIRQRSFRSSPRALMALTWRREAACFLNANERMVCDTS